MIIISFLVIALMLCGMAMIEIMKAPHMEDPYEVSEILWWVVGIRGCEQKRRTYFAADPDTALWRWEQDYGVGWKIEVVTRNADLADSVYGVDCDFPT